MKKYLLLLLLLAAQIVNAQVPSSTEIDLCMKENSVLLLPVKDIIVEATKSKSSQTGGSMTALSAALGVSTMIMTFQISKRLEKDSTRKGEIDILLSKLRSELKSISCFVDQDRETYNQFLAATKLPSATGSEKQYRDAALHIALKNATVLPIEASKHINAVLNAVKQSVQLCSPKVITDLFAATSILSSAEDAMLNFAQYNAEGLEAAEAKTFLADCKSLGKTKKVLQSQILKSISKRRSNGS